MARGLHLGLAEIIEDPRADQAHDQANDCDYDQDFDQRKAAFAASRKPRCKLRSGRRIPRGHML